MEAQVALSGYVGSSVEFVEGEGYCYARFRLGCTPRVRKGDGWGDAETTWIGVSASRRTARHVRDSVRKGDPVVVVGRLRTRVWVDNTGQQHEMLQVVATSLGHDLARGTSVFRRPERLEPSIEDEAARWAVDNVPADRVVDPETGEILDETEFHARMTETLDRAVDEEEVLLAA